MNTQFSGTILTAFLVCAIVGPFLIPALHKLHFGQSIRDCGPQGHLKKNGTPTMGGVMMILAILVATVVWSTVNHAIVIALVLCIGHGVIGFLDDYIKIVLKRNLGLTSKQKLALQILVAVAYLAFPGDAAGMDCTLWIPGLNAQVDLGIWYYILVVFLLVGTTNAVNLTDGLDGLVSSVTVPVALTFAYIAYQLGDSSLVVFALAIAGSCLGFLLFNHHPAKVFMGDTGSLALGGGIAALALMTKTELLLVIIGAVYVAETLSVILQVLYFKATGGKRIFRMSPLHHHYELGGWSENKVVAIFTTASICCCLVGIMLFNAR